MIQFGSIVMHVVIVGSGVASVTAARILRENDPKARISIYTDENHLYYLRPRLYEVLSREAKPPRNLRIF